MTDNALGDATGVAIPACPDDLLNAGPEFLTTAFRAYGALAPDNAVTRIVAAEPCLAGNTGEKLVLTVDYAHADPALHRELFVKFSRFPGDDHRDKRRHELEPEVRLAALSRHPAFPIAVAKSYFADFNHASGTGILITQCIAFGEGGIEPIRVKCMDHELADPLEYYRATMTALARLAAAGKSGQLSPDLERQFPYDRGSDAASLPLPWSEQSLHDAMVRWRQFATNAPPLVPSRVASPAFLDQLEEQALAFLRHEADVRHFLFDDPDYVALLHWNTHLDNAWFWRDGAGALQCGLLDWGMVRHMNMATAIWGGISCGQPAMLDAHMDELITLFADQLCAHGGPRLDRAELDHHFNLATAMIGMAMLMDLPAVLLSRMPDIGKASGLSDPMLREDQVVHGLHLCTWNFLSTWQSRDFGASLQWMLQSGGRQSGRWKAPAL